MGKLNTDRLDDVILHTTPDLRDSCDWSWADLAIREATEHLTPMEARQMIGLEIVKARVRALRHRANDVIGWIADAQAWPDKWHWHIGNLAIAVDGKHIKLQALTFVELERFEIELRRVAAQKFAATNRTASGAQWMAERLHQLNAEPIRLDIARPFTKDEAS